MFGEVAAFIKGAFTPANSIELEIMKTQVPAVVINYANMASVLKKEITVNDILSFRSYSRDHNINYMSFILDESYFNTDVNMEISYMYFNGIPTIISYVNFNIVGSKYRADISESNPLVNEIGYLYSCCVNMHTVTSTHIESDYFVKMITSSKYNGIFATDMVGNSVLLVDILIGLFGTDKVDSIKELLLTPGVKATTTLLNNSSTIVDKLIYYCSNVKIDELLDNSAIIGDIEIFDEFTRIAKESMEISKNDKSDNQN